MRRILFLLAAAAAALLPAGSSHATQMCQDYAVTGVVSLNPPPVCTPYPFEVSCTNGTTGLIVVTVHDSTCIPATFGFEAP